jgi:pimeloyl-ACP methyl ester carboxylesterase
VPVLKVGAVRVTADSLPVSAGLRRYLPPYSGGDHYDWPMSERLAEANGLRLAYQEWGRPDVPACVVLVHGLGSSSHIWDLAAPLLAEDVDVRVVALDQRGHGVSEQPDSGYDFPSVVADLLAFLDAVSITQPALLVGHSWGSSVVLRFAASHPDRSAGLVLIDGGTGSPGERWSWPETEARLTPPDIDGLLWSELYQRMSSSNGAYQNPGAERVGRSLFNVDAAGRVTRLFRIANHMQVVRALWAQRPAELLPQVGCPVLILPARRSSDAPESLANKAANVRRALELQPKARVRWFEDTVHDVPLQRPDELAQELQSFAREVLPALSSSFSG